MDVYEALMLFVGAILFRLFLKPLLKSFALRTKTKLDEKIIDAITNPLWISVVLISINYFFNQYFPDKIVVNIIYSIVAVLVALMAYRLSKIFIFDVLGRAGKGIDAKTKKTALVVLNNLMLLIIAVITLAYIFSVFNIDISPLLASAGIAGLAIGLALKDPLENLFYGVMLALDPSFRVGDVVKIGETVGEVKEIGLRNTKILTFSGDLVSLPNSKVANSQVLNYHLPSDRVRNSIKIGVAYGTDPKKVKKLLVKIAKSSKYVLNDPSPTALFLEYGDFALIFELRFWSLVSNRLDAIDDVNTRIWYEFKKNKIEIPFPITEVHLKKKKR